jgi:GT2 family glycosyltransferase
MKKQPKVAIIIVTYNPDSKFVKICLNSVKKLTNYKNYNFIVSDNNSTNGTKELIKKNFKWADIVENDKNLGFSLANDIAINYALKKYNSDYFFLLNDDSKIIQRNWLKDLVETAESDPKIGIVGGNIIYPNGLTQNSGGYMKGPSIGLEKEIKGILEVDHVGGGAFLIKREVVDKIGLLDKIFSPYLLEETDYCLRVKRAGFKVVSNGNVKIIHYKGQTINKQDEVKKNFIRLKNDITFSLINLKIPFALMRIIFYLPLVMVMKKKDEKKKITPKNIIFRKRFFMNILNILKGYGYLLTHLILIYKKRKERNENKKVWY